MVAQDVINLELGSPHGIRYGIHRPNLQQKTQVLCLHPPHQHLLRPQPQDQSLTLRVLRMVGFKLSASTRVCSHASSLSSFFPGRSETGAASLWRVFLVLGDRAWWIA